VSISIPPMYGGGAKKESAIRGVSAIHLGERVE
jgi:hypothetical protein